jgi:hypothetical protein
MIGGTENAADPGGLGAAGSVILEVLATNVVAVDAV